MNLNLHLKIAGALLLALAMAHVYFPKRFGWRAELAGVSLLTRQIFYVHCFFIWLVLVMFGLLSLVWTQTLLAPSPLARIVLAGLTVFWGARLVIQHLVYDSKLWEGNRFNTLMHVFFTLMWSYYVAVYATALWRQYH
jgi:hypothetical protein